MALASALTVDLYVPTGEAVESGVSGWACAELCGCGGSATTSSAIYQYNRLCETDRNVKPYLK